MSHLSHQALWAYVQGEGSPSDLAGVAAHLELCDACRVRLDEVRFASGLLVPSGQPPVLSDASARRIGDVLARAAEAQSERRLSGPDWRALFSWKPLLVAAAAAALLLWVLRPATLPVEPPKVAQPAPKERPEPPAVQLAVQVTTSRKARGSTGALAKNQSLAAGSVVSTEAGGALWLKLPDGSRAGLTGSTEVTLARIEEKRVELEVAKGDLVVVARHDPSRELKVRAGPVEVRDVGTRFLVSREVARVLVAVEEGAVEVRVGERVLPLAAGRALEVKSGQTRELPWQSPAKATERPAPEKVIPGYEPTPDIPTGPDARKLAANSGTPTPSVEPWTWPTAPATGGEVRDAGAAVASASAAAPDAGTPEEELDSVGTRLRRFAEALARPFIPTRPMRAQQIDDLATEGNCKEALSLANPWLAGDGGTAADEVTARVTVLRAKLRCLTRTGKAAEAEEVRKQLPP